MAAWLSNPASATMQPLFADKPLTSEETADVAAFLDSIKDDKPAGGFDQMLIAGAGGFLLLLAIMAFLIRGPQETYNQRLRRRR